MYQLPSSSIALRRLYYPRLEISHRSQIQIRLTMNSANAEPHEQQIY